MNTNGHRLEITASPDTTLSRLSYALQSALAWFAGQGMHRVTMSRQRSDDGACTIAVTSDLPPSINMYSGITFISELARMGLLPRRIADRERWTVDVANATLIHPEGLHKTLTLGDIAFGVADMIVFLFRCRVTTIRWQLAQSEMQLWAAPGLWPSEVEEIGKCESDNDPLATIGSLPG